MSNYARACERRREALSAQPVCVPPPRVASSVSQQPINVNVREHGPTSSCSSSRHDLGSNCSDHVGKPSALHSPSQTSRLSAVSSDRCVSVANSTAIVFHEYDEQPTGTIKRAPLDVLRRVSHSSSSNGTSQSAECLVVVGTPDDEDSDEEFPAPPPVFSRTSTPSQAEVARVAPAAPPKPIRQSVISPNVSPMKQPPPQCVSPPQMFSPPPQPGTPTPKKAPPPPPKRSDATRIHTAPPTPHMSDLEAALARRREKIAQS
ncbi:hypothetical protein NECAME_17111 [Necator americanus]|uniref:Uncharacterized protein n=1 Tax=Necator americanus TaxID=51031 RepID=W2TU14_NECAM|nr:hypothetical protein NECAME_17111 [Necator americanus]ETN84547.1 hypothetical protein NECAME_17111 [Necator americanus]